LDTAVSKSCLGIFSGRRGWLRLNTASGTAKN